MPSERERYQPFLDARHATDEIARRIADKVAARWPYDPDVREYEAAKQAEDTALGIALASTPESGTKGDQDAE